MKRKLTAILFVLLFLPIPGCFYVKPLEPVTMIVGTWYGFYPFYYAVEKGLDTKHGLKIKILEPSNISNLRRSYLREQVDFAATSMIEFTNAVYLSGERIRPVIVTDYSAGGDVVVANRSISSQRDLLDKRVAVPSNGIGEYVLSLLFDNTQPDTLITQILIPETDCAQAFEQNLIDACVTYPPISTYLLENPALHTVYSSSQHPGRIFDLVWSKPDVSTLTRDKMRTIWFETIAEIERNPDAFHQFIATIASVEKVTVEEAMNGISLVNESEFKRLTRKSDQLEVDLVTVCKVAGNRDCEQFAEAFSW